ncbi:MAG TPA: SRPBCC domain-containing protein [Acidobacteriaceae bacterium]
MQPVVSSELASYFTNCLDCPEVRLEAYFPRSRQCVFNCWTIPEFIELICAVDELQVTAEVNLEPGGRFVITSRSGCTDHHRIVGVFSEIDPGSRLSASWSYGFGTESWSSRVVLEFDDAGGGTRMRVTHVGIMSDRQIQRQTEWWEQRLERMRTFFCTACSL